MNNYVKVQFNDVHLFEYLTRVRVKYVKID